MINPVSLNLNTIHPYVNKKPEYSPVLFKAIKPDVFVSNTPKYSKAGLKNLKEILPIYVRYRESANVKSTAEEVGTYLKKEIKQLGDQIFTAKIGDKPIGFLHYGIERSTLTAKERIRLKAMFVDEEYRGKGVAKELLNNVKKEANGREIIVKARRSNERSPFLYFNSGFKEDEMYYHLTYKD